MRSAVQTFAYAGRKKKTRKVKRSLTPPRKVCVVGRRWGRVKLSTRATVRRIRVAPGAHKNSCRKLFEIGVNVRGELVELRGYPPTDRVEVENARARANVAGTDEE